MEIALNQANQLKEDLTIQQEVDMQTTLFSFTLLVSAFLLFWIQPLIGKIVLPSLGGTPGVWNTCMMFFQGILLIGYGYVHFSVRLLERWQAILHFLLISLALLWLPISTHQLGTPPTEANPIPWLILSLLKSIGLPLLVISSTAPLLQIWYSRTTQSSAKDPYFLYSASNLGSMLGLLFFPFFLEPFLNLQKQTISWSFGFGFLAILIIACRLSLYKKAEPELSAPKVELPAEEVSSLLKPDIKLRLRWILLAFVPSSFLLSTTTILTTDIAAVPLFWVVPLALYILSFIIVFAKRPWISHDWIMRNQVFFLIPLFLLPFIKIHVSFHVPIFIPIYLVVFFIIALACHGELVRLRPQIKYLSEFYLLIAIGGLLGSMFNVLLAPFIFKNYTEYALVLALAYLLRPRGIFDGYLKTDRWIEISYLIVIVGFLLLIQLIRNLEVYFILYTLPVIFILAYPERILQFALGLLTLLLLINPDITKGLFLEQAYIVYQNRSFFGMAKVIDNPQSQARYLIHGKIIHGAQSLNPALKLKTSGYYTPLGPIFAHMKKLYPHLQIAVAGLGAGRLGCYARPSDPVTFYEIDPEVLHVAQTYFDYLKECAPNKKIILGDARLTLKKSDTPFQLIILDAFSSDAVPTHLMTLEAVQMYIQKLAPNGILIFHISNLYLDLIPALSGISKRLGLSALTYTDLKIRRKDDLKFASKWVVISKEPETLMFLKNEGWKPIESRPNDPLWTDDFSNILSVIQ